MYNSDSAKNAREALLLKGLFLRPLSPAHARIQKIRHETMSTSDHTMPDISDWLSTPAPFSSAKHGWRALFSEGNSVVERGQSEDEYNGCVVYTRDPLVVGRVWQITILKIAQWSGTGLVRGCVLCFL